MVISSGVQPHNGDIIRSTASQSGVLEKKNNKKGNDKQKRKYNNKSYYKKIWSCIYSNKVVEQRVASVASVALAAFVASKT